MAEKVTVKAEKREMAGKGYSRRLRQDGKVPVVVYGGGGESVAVSAELKQLAAILRSDSGYNTVFSLDIAGVGPADVMFQDRQIDPVKGRLIHADLRRLTKGEKIEVTVPLHLVGDPVGLKEEGAVLEQQVREIKILCEPVNIPESLDLDVSHLEVGQSLHVSDIAFGQRIVVHEAADMLVASVVLVREEAAEPAAGDAPEGEPEVIGKPKKDDEA
jgi:large subunit ribosomal protein L25